MNIRVVWKRLVLASARSHQDVRSLSLRHMALPYCFPFSAALVASKVLAAVCEGVVLPNLKLRTVDLELFHDDLQAQKAWKFILANHPLLAFCQSAFSAFSRSISPGTSRATTSKRVDGRPSTWFVRCDVVMTKRPVMLGLWKSDANDAIQWASVGPEY